MMDYSCDDTVFAAIKVGYLEFCFSPRNPYKMLNNKNISS